MDPWVETENAAIKVWLDACLSAGLILVDGNSQFPYKSVTAAAMARDAALGAFAEPFAEIMRQCASTDCDIPTWLRIKYRMLVSTS